MKRINLLITDEIKKVREESGLTQKEVAESMGVQQSYISQVESGERNPTLEFLTSFCKLCGCEIGFFRETKY
jgi:transcriptional regulator with XRE-family HTH domain